MVGKFHVMQVTLAVDTSTHFARTLSIGTVIEVPTEPPEGNRLVDVVVDGGAAMMFVTDLQSRAVKID